MPFGQVEKPFQDFYDRAPILINNTFESAALAPHAETSRSLYTVPAGRRFMLLSAVAWFKRVTAGAPVGNVRLMIKVDGTGYCIYISTVKNAVGDTEGQVIGSGPLLLATDTIDIRTQDLSTLGTVDYLISYQGIEFDID